MIEHIVFSGGGPVGFIQYGIIKYLININFIEFKNIKSINATSVGTLIALIFILNIDYSLIDDYLIYRPWHKLYNINNYNYLYILNNKGIFNENDFLNFLKPLFLYKNINNNITLKELYDITKIEFNIYTTKINECQKIKLNHINYPDIKLCTAIFMSCSIPFIFQPCFYKDEFYIDGGIMCNTPICNLEIVKNKESVLILFSGNNNYHKNGVVNFFDDKIKINKYTNFIYYLFFLILNLLKRFIYIQNSVDICNFSNAIDYSKCIDVYDIELWKKILNNKKNRMEFINSGITLANKFVSSKIKNKDNIYNTNTSVIDISCNNYLIKDLSYNI